MMLVLGHSLLETVSSFDLVFPYFLSLQLLFGILYCLLPPGLWMWDVLGLSLRPSPLLCSLDSHPHRVFHYHFSAIFISSWSSRFGDVSIGLVPQQLFWVQCGLLCLLWSPAPWSRHVYSLADQKRQRPWCLLHLAPLISACIRSH